MSTTGCALLVLAVATAPVWLIFLKRRLSAWWIRRLEDRVFRATTPANTAHANAISERRIIFPMASAFSFLFVMTIFAASVVKELRSIVPAWVPPVGALAVACFATAAFYLHYSGRGTRAMKYDLMLTAVVLLQFVGVLVVAGVVFEGSSSVPLDRQPFVFVLIAAIAGGMALLFLVLQIVAFQSVERVASRNGEVAAFHALQYPQLWALSAFCGPLLLVYGLFRFHLFAVIARHPIVYLRAFRGEHAATVFGAVVAKASRRFGIVEGLVHPTQRASTLHQGLDLPELGHFSTTAGDMWRGWVSDRLSRATVAIIDVEDPTRNLEWEISEAVARLTASRVAILTPKGRPVAALATVARFEYTLDGPGVTACRAALEQWLTHTVLARTEPSWRNAGPAST